MYDEFERAVTGRPARAGMSVLGWLAAGFGFLVLVGVVGVGFAAYRAFDTARNVAWDVATQVDAADVGAALGQIDAHTAMVLSMGPEAGLAYLSDLGSGDPAEAFAARMGEGAVEPFRALRGLGDVGRRAGRRGSRGDVRIDLDRTDAGGSLVIDADGEQVRFDLTRRAGGGALSITSAEGNVNFDLAGGDGGGRLIITGDDASVRLGVGDEAAPVPGWVPLAGGMSGDPTPVLSVETSAGTLGAVAWEGSATPGEMLDFYRQALDSQGFAFQEQTRRTSADADEVSFWAKRESDGRVVFLVARRDGARTGALLGFGQER